MLRQFFPYAFALILTGALAVAGCETRKSDTTETVTTETPAPSAESTPPEGIKVVSDSDSLLQISGHQLIRYNLPDLTIYRFNFQVKNQADEVMVIQGVEVLNEQGQAITHSPEYVAALEKVIPIELLTHESFMRDYKENPYDLSTSPFANLAQGTALIQAELSHVPKIKGAVLGNAEEMARTLVVQKVSGALKPQQSLELARHLLFSAQDHQNLKLRIHYMVKEEPTLMETSFTLNDTRTQL